ncbi:(2Fe-2S)-binding protein [Sphingobium sp. BYY-5]|uniref:(2Fe-2S)-binding protein n=1 Tax=Sphingobium sp. BYY-5 TaxID=2926400 RepID=UPI00325BC21C
MKIEINGTDHEIDAEGDTPLLWVIRDNLGLTGTKYGCGIAQCGACSVLIDGVVARSCVTPVDQAIGRKITTIEAIEADAVGQRVVAAWVKHQVPQCGYCQSGQVVAATALLKEVAAPTDDQVDATMTNLCRCGTYNAIRAAIREVAGPRAAEAGAAPDAMLPTGMAIATLATGVGVAIALARGDVEEAEKA